MQVLTYSESRNWRVNTPNSFTEKYKSIKGVRLGEYYRDWNGYKIHKKNNLRKRSNIE
jgi:hypothetical protein